MRPAPRRPRRPEPSLAADPAGAPPRRPPDWRLFAAGAVFGALLAAVLIVFATNARRGDPAPAAAFLAANARQPGVVTSASGLQYRWIAKGAGPTPGDDDVVTVAYTGRLADGTVFDSSPRASFAVGGVVPGFAEALRRMPRGSRLRVWVPPPLGYRDRAAGPIPPQSALVFDIHMIDFAPKR